MSKNNSLTTVSVFCGPASGNDPNFLQLAKATGKSPN